MPGLVDNDGAFVSENTAIIHGGTHYNTRGNTTIQTINVYQNNPLQDPEREYLLHSVLLWPLIDSEFHPQNTSRTP